jgi:hypothetical protein
MTEAGYARIFRQWVAKGKGFPAKPFPVKQLLNRICCEIYFGKMAKQEC